MNKVIVNKANGMFLFDEIVNILKKYPIMVDEDIKAKIAGRMVKSQVLGLFDELGVIYEEKDIDGFFQIDAMPYDGLGLALSIKDTENNGIISKMKKIIMG